MQSSESSGSNAFIHRMVRNSATNGPPSTLRRRIMISPKLAFLLVSASLGELGDGLNIFQGIYLVGLGWNEGSVGVALSLMGLTSLVIQPWAGDWVDKTTVDRRIFLAVASIVTALSASAILLVRTGNVDHALMFATKIVEGVTASFLGPCLAALTLATFGPHHFDAVMASNILWGHLGSVASAVLAGVVSHVLYPQQKFCFLVIGASALLACFFVQYLPQGDPLMGRGFQGKVAMDEHGDCVEPLLKKSHDDESTATVALMTTTINHTSNDDSSSETPEAVSYWQVFADMKSVILCVTGFFFHFANANVLLVLGELMGRDEDENGGGGGQPRRAIPLVAGAIVTAQITMAAATHAGDKLTTCGVGRKPLFLTGLASLPVRCALILWLKDAGATALLATQILDGLGGGLIGLVHPFLVADISFGTGRFNVLMGVTAACFGLGATLSNFFGQMVVEQFGHVTSLMASLVISLVPVLLFLFMPETLGMRTQKQQPRAGSHDESNYLSNKASGIGTSTDSSGSSYGSCDH